MVARRYHEQMKHSLESVRRDQHFLDWDNQPRPSKLYHGLDEVGLPSVEARTGPAVLDVLEGTEGAVESLTLESLSRLLYDGHVFDFFRVGIAGFRAGIFNLADTAIALGLLCLFLSSLPRGRGSRRDCVGLQDSVEWPRWSLL